MERLFKANNRFFVKTCFIDKNDAFKMQNNLNILVENEPFIEIQS